MLCGIQTVEKPYINGTSWTPNGSALGVRRPPTDGYFTYYECRGELCSPANNNVYRQSQYRTMLCGIIVVYIFEN